MKLYNNNNNIEKTIKTWSVELTAGGQSLAEVKIQRSIFQGDARSPLLFEIAMLPLNRILRKCTAGHKLCKPPENINHLMYMDGIKRFAKNENELTNLIQTVRIYSQDTRRCPWCNAYRRRKWTRRLELKSWTRLIAFHIALLPLGKVWIQLFSLQLWINSRTDWVLQLW